MGDYDRAIADAAKAIDLNPKLAAAYGTRGFAFAKKGDVKSAIADYRRQLALAPNNHSSKEVLQHLGASP